jgi:hypothetical protein
MSWKNSKDSVRTLVFSVAVLALTVAGLIFTSSLSGSTAEAAAKGSQPVSPSATFNADPSSLGAIPDRGAGGCGTGGPTLNVTFNVTGLTGAPTSVSVNLTGVHTWVGDVQPVLIAPDSTSFPLFSRTGATTATSCGDSSDLGGPYNFTDSASGTNWWAAAATASASAAIPAGDYRTTAVGPQPVGNTSPVTDLSAAFAGVSNPNGTWTLAVSDFGGGDTGTITAASLTIETGGGGTPTQATNYDVNADGMTDYGVVRASGALAAKGASVDHDLVPYGGDKRMTPRQMLAARKQMAQNLGETTDVTWYSATTNDNTIGVTSFGDSFSDTIIPADFDGDGASDIAVWRSAATDSAFYILQSSDATVRTEVFGQEGDDPTVVGDYDGDGMADPAVYRCPPFSGDAGACYFYYRGSNNNPSGGVTFVPWGFGVDFDFFTAPGDYDGDGKLDFCIQRADPTNPANAQFLLLRSSDNGVEYINWGVIDDIIVPGDYDGDGKTDLCVRRTVSGTRQHWVLFRNGTFTFFVWGINGDQSAPGDYDGDGKTDFAIRRPSTGDFWVNRSADGSVAVYKFGVAADQVTAGWQVK